MDSEIRVIIADDQEGMRMILRKMIAKAEGFTLCAEATSGQQMLELVETYKPQVCFLDVEMPGLSGIHVGAELKEHNPQIKIFIVTSYPDYLDEAMRSGLKQVRIVHGKGTGVLRTAVQQALKKNKYVKSYRLGVYGEGEDGVTIAEFR